MFRIDSNPATTGVHYFAKIMRLMNRMAISYVKIHIFDAPDGQQPSNDRRSLYYKQNMRFMNGIAILIELCTYSMFQITRPGKFLNGPDDMLKVQIHEPDGDSYVNMHIFDVPHGQQPRYEDRPTTQQRQAFIILQKACI